MVNAFDFIKNKGITATWNWNDLTAEEHLLSFTSAKILRLDILENIKNSLVKAEQGGLTKSEAIQLIGDSLKSAGYVNNAWRLETIYRTNMQSAYMSRRWQTHQRLREFRPYLKYKTQEDERVRITHQKLDNKVFHMDDKIWNKIYPPNGYNCYDDMTEVFTDRGWRLFNQLDGTEKFLSQNKETRNIEWTKAKKHIKKQVNEKLVHFSSRTMDVMVTKDHDMLVMTDWNLKHKKKIKTIKAKDVSKSSYLPRTANWVGINKERIQIYGYDFDTHDLCKFLAYYLADGSCSYRGGNTYEAKITQSSDSDKSYIINSFKELPFKLSIRQESLGILANYEFKKFLHSLGKSHTKYIPDYIFSLDKKYLLSFIEAYLFTDGHTQKPHVHNLSGNLVNGSKMLFTTSKMMLNGLSEIAIKCGYAPSFRTQKPKTVLHKNVEYTGNYDCYTITLTKKENALIGETKEVDYRGYVYCVELEKNNTLWVRRNGKAIWCGNCRCYTVALTKAQAERQGISNINRIPKNFPDVGFDINVGVDRNIAFNQLIKRTNKLPKKKGNKIIGDFLASSIIAEYLLTSRENEMKHMFISYIPSFIAVKAGLTTQTVVMTSDKIRKKLKESSLSSISSDIWRNRKFYSKGIYLFAVVTIDNDKKIIKMKNNGNQIVIVDIVEYDDNYLLDARKL